MSDFATLQTALSGLLAHRRAMDVIGHNVANANTDGFTRRRVDLVPVGSIQGAQVFARTTKVGRGVDVADVVRLRDGFLDDRMRQALAADGSAGQVASIMNQVEALLAEPSDTGIAKQLTELWGAWADAANRPGDVPTRAALLERATSLTQTFARASASFNAIREQQRSELTTTIDQVNADARQVAELNKSVIAARAAGGDADDLADQRDVIVDRLSRTVGATARIKDDGSVDVFIGGSTLVRGDKADGLKVVVGGPLDPPFAAMPLQKVDVRWASDGYAVNQLSGEIAGRLVGIGTLIPGAIQQLDTVAATLVSSVNALHSTGHGLAAGDVNLTFFDPAGTTAATLAVSSDVAGQPSRIALAAGTGGTLDSTLGHSIASLIDSPTGADASYRNYVGQLGVEVQTAARRADMQSKISGQVDADRKAATGVSLDEEMTSLVATQRAYEASARVITAVDQLLDLLVNRTGMVGR